MSPVAQLNVQETRLGEGVLDSPLTQSVLLNCGGALPGIRAFTPVFAGYGGEGAAMTAEHVDWQKNQVGRARNDMRAGLCSRLCLSRSTV
jgi:hypothetical protein